MTSGSTTAGRTPRPRRLSALRATHSHDRPRPDRRGFRVAAAAPPCRPGGSRSPPAATPPASARSATPARPRAAHQSGDRSADRPAHPPPHTPTRSQQPPQPKVADVARQMPRTRQPGHPQHAQRRTDGGQQRQHDHHRIGERPCGRATSAIHSASAVKMRRWCSARTDGHEPPLTPRCLPYGFEACPVRV
jgi:hypothetical protein